MQFKNSYNTSFADRDSERKPPSVPLSGPTGVGVPHAKVAQASSTGLAASSAHGTQAPAAYQGSTRHYHNNSPILAKGPNSEAYLPPALRNQNQHGIAGANSDCGAHGASSNGYGSDYTRQQHFPSQNQFQTPSNQTYGNNQDDENQGRWAQPSHVKRDAPPSSSQYSKYPQPSKQQPQHQTHPSYPSQTPFNEKGPNPPPQYQHHQQNPSSHSSYPPYEQWSDSVPLARGGSAAGAAPPATEPAGPARGGGQYQVPGGVRGGSVGGGNYNNHHQLQGGETGAPHSARGGFGGGSGSGGFYGREDTYHHQFDQQYPRQPFHQPPLPRRGGGRGGGGSYGSSHNYNPNNGQGNSGPNRFQNHYGANNDENAYQEPKAVHGQQFNSQQQQTQQHPQQQHSPQQREALGINQPSNAHLNHGPSKAYHHQPTYKGPPSPNVVSGKPQHSGGFPSSGGGGVGGSPPSLGSGPTSGGGSHESKNSYFNGNGRGGGNYRESYNGSGPPRSLLSLDSRQDPAGAGFNQRDASPSYSSNAPPATHFEEKEEAERGGNNSAVSPRDREDQSGNRNPPVSSSNGGGVSPLQNPPSLLSSPDASADWTPGVKESYFKEAVPYLQQHPQQNHGGYNNLGSGFPSAPRGNYQDTSPREIGVENPPVPKPTGLYQPPAQRRQQQQLSSTENFELRFGEGPAEGQVGGVGGSVRGVTGSGRGEDARRGFPQAGQPPVSAGSGPERGPRGGFQPTTEDTGKVGSGGRDFREGNAGISPLLQPGETSGNNNSRSHSPRGGQQDGGKWSGNTGGLSAAPRANNLAQSERGSPAGSGAPSPLFPPGATPNSSGSGNRTGTSTPTAEVTQGGSATPPNGPIGGVQPLLGGAGRDSLRSLPTYPAGGRGSGGSVGSHNSRAATPSSSVASVSDQDRIFKKVRGILNKLTPDKFDKLSLELLNVGIDSPQILKGIILLIFEKALDEPKYSSLYAQLCRRLHDDAPNFDPPAGSGVNGAAAAAANSSFSRLLLNKCKDEFENRYKATNEFELKRAANHGKPLTDDEEEQALIAKSKMLGNIKFIGELGKLNMLHERILHQCVKQLLEKKKETPTTSAGAGSWPSEDEKKKAATDPKAADNEVKEAENLECLCHLIRTVGPRLDKPEAKAWMDAYYERIKAFRQNQKLPSRIRFMLQDIIDLRAQRWATRRIGMSLQDSGPRTIQQVREDAAKDLGISVKGLGQKGESASDSPRDIQSLFYGATMGDPNADLFQDMGLFLPGSQSGSQGLNNPLTAFEMPRGGPDFFSSGSSRSASSQSPTSKTTGSDGGKGVKSVSFVDDLLNGSGAGGGGSSGGNLPINLIGAASGRRDEDEGRPTAGSGSSGPDYAGEKRGVKLERLDPSRGLTDRQENDKSFDRVTSNDRSKERPQQPRRGEEEENKDAKGGGAGGGAGGRGEKNEIGNGGRRKTDEDSGNSGKGEKDFGGKPSGGGVPWGKQFDDTRREDNARMGDDDLGPPLSYRGGRGGGRGGRGGRGGNDNSFRRDEPFPPFRPESNQSDLGGSSYRGGRGAQRGFGRREDYQNDSRVDSDRRAEENVFPDRGGRGGRGRGGRGGRGGRSIDEKPRFGDGEMSAAQEAAQIKNAIFPQPKLTLKTSVLPLNTEEISLRPATFGGPPSKSSSGSKLSSGKSKQKSPLTPETGAETLTPQLETLSVKSNSEKALKNKASPLASRTATSPSTVTPAVAAEVPDDAPPPPPFDEAAAVEALKSLVAKAMENLPADSPATSQRSTPEPGGVSVGFVEPDSAKRASRDRVLEVVAEGVAGLGKSGGNETGKIPPSFLPNLLSTVLLSSAESSASRSVAAIVVAALEGVETSVAPSSGGVVQKSVALIGFEALLAQTPSLESAVPKIKSVAANVAAQLVLSEKLSLQQIAQPLKGGAHFPLFLLTLQAIVKDPKHKEEAEARAKVKSLVDQCEIQLPEMVPQTSLPNLLSVFSDRGLGFLLPLLRFRVELTKVVKDDPSPKALYSWLQDHVDEDPQLKASADFIHILTSVLLTYVTEQTSDGSSDGSKSKEKTEQERLLLAKFSPILKKFVEGDDVVDLEGGKGDDDGGGGEEKRDLGKIEKKSSNSKAKGGTSDEMRRQIALVYALQVFCHTHKWPKGLLLRLFTYMYDLEVVEEEAFLQWKEDLNDTYPGKGKALFQVNQWLTWLEQAESEEEDEA